MEDEGNLGLLLELKDGLVGYYAKVCKGGEKPASKNKYPTDTLVSKILLGTLGCVPAYDRYFRSAVVEHRVATSIFSRNSVFSLCKFYEENEIELEEVRAGMKLECSGIEYPQMKLLDMAFWEIGRDLEKKE